MKALLMYRNRDFDVQQALPWNEPSLTQDLELDTLLHAMAGNDKFLYDVARVALLIGPQNDVDTILYRQEIVKDCLKSPALVRELFDLTGETIEATKRQWWDLSSHYPDSVLYSSMALLESLSGMLRKLRGIAEETGDRFESAAFTTLFAMLRMELGDEYLASIQNYLTELRFRAGVLLSAELGESNEGVNYELRQPPVREPSWLKRMLAKEPPGYTFHIDPRDEAGAQIVAGMRHRGISRVAIALARSADHVLNFFKLMRAELAFYIGCLNLQDKMAA